ncbi:hypothetical protein T261_1599 [Streptomyces lydicus]|nr:hypothetical protein T261_1599 [Streptomyces lydicus]
MSPPRFGDRPDRRGLLSRSGDLAVVGTVRHRGHGMFGVPRSTVYGHLDKAKAKTVPPA